MRKKTSPTENQQVLKKKRIRFRPEGSLPRECPAGRGSRWAEAARGHAWGLQTLQDIVWASGWGPAQLGSNRVKSYRNRIWCSRAVPLTDLSTRTGLDRMGQLNGNIATITALYLSRCNPTPDSTFQHRLLILLKNTWRSQQKILPHSFTQSRCVYMIVYYHFSHWSHGSCCNRLSYHYPLHQYWSKLQEDGETTGRIQGARCVPRVRWMLRCTPVGLIKPQTKRPLWLPVHLSAKWRPSLLSMPLQIPASLLFTPESDGCY